MKIFEPIEKSAKKMFIDRGVSLLSTDPEKNAAKVFDLAKKFIKTPYSRSALDFIYNTYQTNPPTHEYVQNILKNGNPKCIKSLFANFFANATWFGVSKREKYLTEEDTKIPFVILLSPSMRCNLHCQGCYAANYDKQDNIPFAEVDRIIKEARDLGIYYFIILGGEPFFVDYMLRIYEKYDDVIFTPFTNGTLFDDDLADKLQRLGNVFPIFSLEGWERDTDARRGKGVFNKVMQGMSLLKTRGVLFGVSSAVNRNNLDVVTSDKFIDLLIEKGSEISFYFMYMPVGQNPDISMMLTPEQRLVLGQRVRHIRVDKPYFAIDFFNDAPYIGGCISGKYYCHINAKEEVEPCIFAHFACDNLKGKSLLEVFQSNFFKVLRRKQPYNNNLLMPCMMIDNPKVIRTIVRETGAHPTDASAKQMISDPRFMQQLDKLAQDFQPYAQKAWKEEFHETGNADLAKG